MLRDRCTCRVPGCGRRRYVDVHHLASQAEGGAHSRANCIVLCTTHHRLLHEGKLRIEGNADGMLDVRDSSEAPMGVLSDERESVTQGGSSPAQCLLRVMGRRPGWSTDELVESSGLSASTELGAWEKLPEPPLAGRVLALVASMGDTMIVAGGWDRLCPPGAAPSCPARHLGLGARHAQRSLGRDRATP